MKVDELDDFFKMIDKMLNNHFYGAYKKDSINNEYEEFEDDDIADIYEDNKYIYITMELRGLQEEDIKVSIEPYKLVLELMYDGKVFEQEFKLPCKVKTKGKISYNNFVLDVVLTKDKRKVKNGKIKKTRAGKKGGRSTRGTGKN